MARDEIYRGILRISGVPAAALCCVTSDRVRLRDSGATMKGMGIRRTHAEFEC